jgi:hypothetical protein
MSDSIRREHRFTVTPEHLTLDPRVSDRAHRLWCRLDRFAGSRQSATSYRETLSVEMDCSLSSVDRALDELASAGWLRIERQPGGASSYTLTVAPQRTVERLAEKARQERAERWGNQRRRKPSAQVSEGGVVMGDDTLRSDEGVVMGDEGVSSPVTTGVVMGDAHKEPTETREETLANDADASTAEAALFVVPAAVEPKAKRTRKAKEPKPPDPALARAKAICGPWWESLRIKPAGGRSFMNVSQLVAQDVIAGRTDAEIRRALDGCGVAVTRAALNFQYEKQDRADRTTRRQVNDRIPEGW